ncbi:MAG: hypothetical protein PHC46_05145 [Clostridia bacterium]|nr:hypothetical protein [Clostridia bacterium]
MVKTRTKSNNSVATNYAVSPNRTLNESTTLGKASNEIVKKTFVD